MNAPIPIYALYGESQSDQSWLHWETITSRSRLHGFRIEPHRHANLFQILYLTKGEAEVVVDGSETRLSAPAVVTVPPLSVHGFRFSTDVKGYVLTLFARDVQGALADAPEIAETVMNPRLVASLGDAETQHEIARSVRALILEADRQAPGRMLALKARLSLLLIAIQRASRVAPAAGNSRPGRAEQLVRSFQQLVDSHFRESRAIGFYAARLSITPTHLNRVCRQILATSAHSVIERRIILEAKRYLQFSPLSVKEIGIVLGYPDPAYFSRFFAQRTGVAPSVYRNEVYG